MLLPAPPTRRVSTSSLTNQSMNSRQNPLVAQKKLLTVLSSELCSLRTLLKKSPQKSLLHCLPPSTGEPKMSLVPSRIKVTAVLAGPSLLQPPLKVTLLSIQVTLKLFPPNNSLVAWPTPTTVVEPVVAWVLLLN